LREGEVSVKSPGTDTVTGKAYRVLDRSSTWKPRASVKIIGFRMKRTFLSQAPKPMPSIAEIPERWKI
jgi:hypothetical protein